jgi:hypothetical protein
LPLLRFAPRRSSFFHVMGLSALASLLASSYCRLVLPHCPPRLRRGGLVVQCARLRGLTRAPLRGARTPPPLRGGGRKRGGLRRVHKRKNRVSGFIHLIFSCRLPASFSFSQRLPPNIFHSSLLIANWAAACRLVLPRSTPRRRRGGLVVQCARLRGLTRAPLRGARTPPPLRGGGRRAWRLSPLASGFQAARLW